MRAYLDGVTISDERLGHIERWLEAFDVAIPFRPYNELVESHGDDAERERTRDLCIDLRQPVYDPRMIFTREDDSPLMAALEDERQHCHCTKLCGLPLLRAIWLVKPLILALPISWANEQEGT